MIHQRTDGNPLFMVNVVDYLVAQGMIGQVDGRWELKKEAEEAVGGVPENLRQMIEQQIARLSPEGRQMLEAASVAGVEFSAMAVAAGLEMAVGEVEEQCEELARREQFLRAQGTADWPDGTVAAHYGFLHTLYQEVLYNRIPAGRRQRLHRQIGERQEAAYGERAREIAAELAMHFERGQEYHKAIQYLRQAGENAVRRSAHQEAISLLIKGVELLKLLPETSERAQQELRLQVALGSSLQAIKGFAAPEVERVYARIQELCQQEGAIPRRFLALAGLTMFYQTRAEYQMVYENGAQLLRLAQDSQDRSAQMRAHLTLGSTSLWLGEIISARAHLEQVLALHDPLQPIHVQPLIFPDPKVAFLPYLAFLLEVLGYPDQAQQRSQEALTLAQGLTHPFSLAYVLNWTNYLHQVRGEGRLVQEQAEALVALCTEQGFAQLLATGVLLQGWALTEQGQAEEGIAQIRQGLAMRRATGAANMQTYFLALLAEAYGKAGQLEEGLSALAEALTLVSKTGERYYEVELYRLKGQLTLQQFKAQSSRFEVTNPQSLNPNPQAEAEACFLKAVEIARKQQAKSLELRAVMSLSRLWQQQGKKKQARRMLTEIYGWFTEGFDTKDLQEAKALLEELNQ